MKRGKTVLAVILIITLLCLMFIFLWLSGNAKRDAKRERADTVKSNLVGKSFTAEYEETYFPPGSWVAEKYSVFTETYTFNNDGTVTIERLERYTDSFVVLDGDIRLEHSDSSVKTFGIRSMYISVTGEISMVLSSGVVIGIEVNSSNMPVSISVDSHTYT